MSVRVRYAPSPTGDLHLGSLRTILFDFLLARQQGGSFIMRVEDTDQNRLVEGSLERQLQGMYWMGVGPDEGVMFDEHGHLTEKGPFGPYTQSKRLPIYHEHAKQLLDSGAAYRCFCTPERLESMRAEQQANHQPPRYDRHCRNLSPEESTRRAEAGEKFVIRHAMPDNREIKINDVIRGELSFNSSDLDDYVLLKSDGYPTYQLANVVDDHLMEISHVLRGEEWIPSLPKNVLLYEAFGWQPPLFAHVPVILGPDKAKLSKRHGAEPVLTYQERGYLPDAIFNALVFIGWSPGTEQEFFTRDELIEAFRLEKVQKSAAVFNLEKLDYVNGWYIRHLPVGDMVERMQPFWDAAGFHSDDPEYLMTVARVVQERMKHFDETQELTWFFFRRPEVNEGLKLLIVPKKSTAEQTHQALAGAVETLENVHEWTHEALEESLFLYINKNGYKNMEVLWPIRAALTGVQASPGAFEMLEVLGKQESLERLRAVIG